MTVADQALVWILGQSMGMPYDRSFEAQSPALAFLGVVLAMIGFTDIVTLSMPEEIALVHHWGAQGTYLTTSFPRTTVHPSFFSLTLKKLILSSFAYDSAPPLPLLLRPLHLRLPLQRLLPLVPRGCLRARPVDELARLAATPRRRVQPVRLGRRLP